MPERRRDANKELNPREQADLDVTIAFLKGLVRRDPHYVEALQLLGDDYTRRGRFQDGLAVDEQLVQLRPGDPLVQFNLACSYSLTSQFELAAAALDKALDLGYRDFTWLGRDPDLKALRSHPLYENIRSKVRKLKIKIS
jgi:tetratricopeptide (TPR) repeat protein